MAHISEQPRLQNNETTDPRTHRSACERCRAQKLKCIRSSGNSHLNQCDRCAKAGLECHTCPSLPPGRPRMGDDGKPPMRLATKRKRTDKSYTQPCRGSQADQARLLHSMPMDDPNTPATTETFLPTREERTTQFVRPNALIDAMNGTYHSTVWNHPPSLVTEQGLDAADMVGGGTPGVDFMSLPGLDGWTDTSQFNHLPFSSPMDKKRYYLDKLADLNATLLRYIADIDSPEPSGKHTVSQPNPLSTIEAEPQRKPNCAAHDPSHEAASVGQMLGFLQEFLGILKYYVVTIPITSAPRLASSPNSADSDDGSEPDFESEIPGSITETHNPARNGTYWDQPLIRLASDSKERRVMDYPTILALSTCYVSLVRLYRDWLQNMVAILEASALRLHHEMAANQPTHPGGNGEQDRSSSSSSYIHLFSDIPEVLPHVQLDGFQLGNYRTLQISVFMQVSMDLLWRIERAVAALAATDSTRSPASSETLPLLKTMLQQEARTSKAAASGRQQRKLNEGEEIGLQSLKSLVRTIRKNLQGNVCLQLEEGVSCADLENFVL